MGLFTNRAITFPPPQDLIPRRTARPNRLVTQDTAFHTSVVWSALRLRASLISSFPIDVFRRQGGYQVETPIPYVLQYPGGPRVTLREWMYSSQMDLDRTGNCFGIISMRDGAGLPARIDLVAATDVQVVKVDGQLAGYRIHGTVYDPTDIWHEKQYTIPGLDIGLSPIAYASWCLGTYASIDQWAVEFLDNSTQPGVILRNTARQMNDVAAKDVKDKYRASVANGDPFVIGADWESTFLKMDPTGLNWLAVKQYSAEEIARFFDVPHDLLDIASSGTSGSAKMTYANLQQRNMQFLIMNLQPAIQRREEALSNGLLPNGASITDQRANRYVKMNTSALLRLDDLGRAQIADLRLGNHSTTVSEVRELENQPPLTPAQLEEIKTIAAAAAGPMAPPEPVPNPNAKGVSQSLPHTNREYVPIDVVGGSGVGPAMADQAHCSDCHERIQQLAADLSPTVGSPGMISQVDEQGGSFASLASGGDPTCQCPPGCSCNPLGLGCLYPTCPCDEPRATPTYTPPGTTPQWQGEGFTAPTT